MKTRTCRRRKRQKHLSNSQSKKHHILRVFLQLYVLMFSSSYHTFHGRVLVVHLFNSLSTPVGSEESKGPLTAAYHWSQETPVQNDGLENGTRKCFALERIMDKSGPILNNTTTELFFGCNGTYSAGGNASLGNIEAEKLYTKLALFGENVTEHPNITQTKDVKLKSTNFSNIEKVLPKNTTRRDSINFNNLNLSQAEVLMSSKLTDERSSAFGEVHMGPFYEEKPLALSSCYRRYGTAASYPCSCERKCVVHGNCCDDLATECSKLFQQAMHIFKDLRPATIRCDRASAVFMVESCPSVLEASEDDSMDFSSTGESLNGQTKGKDDEGFSALSDITAAAPVTDLTTGVVYSNASIFHCNRKHTMEFLSQWISRSMRPWFVQLAIGQTSDQLTISEVLEALKVTSFSYIPPKDTYAQDAVMCHNDIVLNCISQLSAEMGFKEIACYMSANEYYENIDKADTMSDKNYTLCAQCVLKYQKEEGVYVGRFFWNDFGILASMSEVTGQIEFEKRDFTKRTTLPWSSWACDTAETQDTCHVLKCDERFSLTPQGQCRKTVDFEISLQPAFTLENTSCTVDLLALAQPVQCYFRTYYWLRPMSQANNVTTSFDDERQTNVTILKMAMYIDLHPYEHGMVTLFEIIDTIFPAMEFFIGRQCALLDNTAQDNLAPSKENVELSPPEHSDNTPKLAKDKLPGENKNSSERTGEKPLKILERTSINEAAKFKHCILLTTGPALEQECDLSNAKSFNVKGVTSKVFRRNFFLELKNLQYLQDKKESNDESGGELHHCFSPRYTLAGVMFGMVLNRFRL